MVDVLIALGSNVGNSLANLREAVRRLSEELNLLGVSAIYETAPMYVEDQPKFLNAAILVQADLGPREVLKLLKGLEQEIGRQTRQVFGPREIDLDQVPHPRVPERRFVLQPVADVAPEFILPGLGCVSELLKETESQSDSVIRLDHALLPVPSHQ